MRRSSLISCVLWQLGDFGDALQYQTGGKGTLWDWTSNEQPWNGYTDPLQTRVLCLDYALQCLKGVGNWNIIQDQVSNPQLSVCMDEHFSFQDLIQAYLIHEAKVGDDNVSICKTIRKDKGETSLVKINAN